MLSPAVRGSVPQPAPLPRFFRPKPFFHLTLEPDGHAKLCCRAKGVVTSQSRALSLHRETFDQIWNSDAMGEARRGLLAGDVIPACESCYRTEAEGGRSLRQSALSGLPPGQEAAMLAAARAMVGQGDKPVRPPATLQLLLGNLCNLKCRMCSSVLSSQIAADPVHSRWRPHLDRVQHLLPELAHSAEYTGLAAPVSTSGAVRRLIMDRAAVEFQGNDAPVSRVEVRGHTDGFEPTELAVYLNDVCMTRQDVAAGDWKVDVFPDPPFPAEGVIRMVLEPTDRSRAVWLDTLSVETRPRAGRSYPREMSSRLPDGLSWAESRDVLVDEVFAHPETLVHIDFAGGEPLLNPHLPGILERLIEDGHASHIRLRFSSNATVYSDGLVALLRQFQDAFIGFSLDATAALQEYLRPPSRWDVVTRNVRSFIDAGVRQAYNVFGLLELVRYCDEEGLSFGLGNTLAHPRYLSFEILPESIVEEARAEWEDYKARECRAEHIVEVDTLLAALRRPRPADREALQDEFIRFTNDLDRSRGQSLAAANPRLYDRLCASGFKFEGKHRFA